MIKPSISPYIRSMEEVSRHMNSQFITDLLYQNECVIIPGFGGFLTSYLPARIVKESNRFFPPSYQVAFNASLTTNDGLLANHLSKELNVNYREALDIIQDWVETSRRSLQHGQKLELEGLGIVSLSLEGNLNFEPEVRVEFPGNSFGLPSFSAVPVERTGKKDLQMSQRVQPWTTKVKYLVPEALKWAAVIAPFIALTIWGSINMDQVKGYVHSYSGFFSLTGSSNVSHVSNKVSDNPVEKGISESAFPVSPGSIVLPSGEAFAPEVISYTALRKNYPVQTAPAVSAPKEDVKLPYHIIGGAFREHTNALKLIEELKSKGYAASIVDTTSKGMYIVSIQGFSKRQEAAEKLDAVRSAGYTGAWVMHSN
ncbi:MAG: SPOR domain-containing protein [Bacteroidales bacterium]|nr:SPOR domain-containing protein [Bacteroidales bacterium]